MIVTGGLGAMCVRAVCDSIGLKNVRVFEMTQATWNSKMAEMQANKEYSAKKV